MVARQVTASSQPFSEACQIGAKSGGGGRLQSHRPPLEVTTRVSGRYLVYFGHITADGEVELGTVELGQALSPNAAR